MAAAPQETTPDTSAPVWTRVAVIGAGAMGAQIAGVIALSGREVALADTARDALDRAGTTLRGRWDSRVAKGAMTAAERDAAYGRITFSDNVSDAVSDVDLVIEAVVEKLDVKRDLFSQVDGAARPGTVISSNSSSFVPSSMAEAIADPTRFLGLHFFNPALVMKCVEVIAGPQTDPQLMSDGTRFVEQIGKEPVVLRKEINGFVANRILNAVRDEAIYLLEGGYASVTDIDRACRTALGYPMGPFELMDLTGVDIGYLTKKARYAASGDPKDAPSRTVSGLFDTGQLGRKSGRGFYVYDDKGVKQGENTDRPGASD
ncbi:MAG: 3-hydroxyacyl-CoA dehydrogenase family protein [Tetrasphaera sp.]